MVGGEEWSLILILNMIETSVSILCLPVSFFLKSPTGFRSKTETDGNKLPYIVLIP